MIFDQSPHLEKLIESYPDRLNDLYILNYYSKHKIYSKILYGLSLIKFSGSWEIHILLCISRLDYIRRCLDNLVSQNILIELTKDHPDYEIIKIYWKNQHRNSPKFPNLYLINDSWAELIKNSSILFKRFFSESEILKLGRRSNEYENNYKWIKKHLENRDKSISIMVGKCKLCKSNVKSSSGRLDKFVRIGEAIVCSKCKSNITTDMIRKWTKLMK